MILDVVGTCAADFHPVGASKISFTVWISHIVFTSPIAMTIINSRMETIPKSMKTQLGILGQEISGRCCMLYFAPNYSGIGFGGTYDLYNKALMSLL